ncbi:hypothetical protein [Fodinicola feengrottensis]|uniref:hypothetical protein n=1 Tax=Fodinicola feengrottensis TaxID=435914 RepID=UPI0013CFE5C3|nr:hypothetical protein [Fodinicola feengrottensis]
MLLLLRGRLLRRGLLEARLAVRLLAEVGLLRLTILVVLSRLGWRLCRLLAVLLQAPLVVRRLHRLGGLPVRGAGLPPVLRSGRLAPADLLRGLLRLRWRLLLGGLPIPGLLGLGGLSIRRLLLARLEVPRIELAVLEVAAGELGRDVRRRHLRMRVDARLASGWTCWPPRAVSSSCAG